MPNELPTFQELLAAQQAARGQGPAQAALTGINQGVDLGRSILEKNRDNEDRKQKFLQEVRKLTAGTLQPGDTPETIGQRERTPEVQAALTPKPKEPKEPGNLVKLSENDEGVLVYDPATRNTKTIPFKGKKKEGAGGNKTQQLDSASTMLQNVKEILKEVPSGGKGMVQEFLSKDIAGRGMFDKKEARTYQQIAPAASVAVYRGVTGDTRLSDADAAARARPLFPYEGEPQDVREAKLTFLDKLLADQRQVASGGAEQTPLPIEAIIMEQQKFLKGGGAPATGTPAQPTGNPGEMIRVKEKKSGQTGSLPANEFDPNVYERL